MFSIDATKISSSHGFGDALSPMWSNGLGAVRQESGRGISLQRRATSFGSEKAVAVGELTRLEDVKFVCG